MIAPVETNISRSYPAVPEMVPVAREAVAELARTSGASHETVDAVRLALSEALTNAVLHAYPDRPGPMHVTAAVVSGDLWVLVADDGCGLRMRPTRPGLGLGLALIAHESDEFTVAPRAARGVELRMRFDLTPAVLTPSPLRLVSHTR